MKKLVISIVSSKGIKTNYIFLSEKDKKKTLFELQHKMRVKQILFGEVFTYYNEEMDFTFALNNGCKILTDKRNDK